MMGLKDSQIVQHGLPIRPDFSRRPAATWLLRRRLGLHASLPAVLMVGGGEGMGKLEATVRAIGKKGTRCQVAVICGRNDKLKAKLDAGDWGPAVEVHAFGFVSNMHEFMSACDAIITKAGALLRCSWRLLSTAVVHKWFRLLGAAFGQKLARQILSQSHIS